MRGFVWMNYGFRYPKVYLLKFVLGGESILYCRLTICPQISTSKVVKVILLLFEQKLDPSSNTQNPSIFLKFGKVSHNSWKPVLKTTIRLRRKILGQGIVCKCNSKKKSKFGDSTKLILFNSSDTYYKILFMDSFQPQDCVIMFYSFISMKLSVIIDSPFFSFGFGRINHF